MNATRILKIAAVAVVVLGLEWRLAAPESIASDPERWPIPWAMLAVMFPVGLAVWAFEHDERRRGDARIDLLWGLLLGTLGYCTMALAA